MNLKRLYLIFFILSFVGFDSQNCLSAGEDKTSVSQEAKLLGGVAKQFAVEKTAQAKAAFSKTGASVSSGAGRVWSWLGAKCSWARDKSEFRLKSLKKTSSEKGAQFSTWAAEKSKSLGQSAQSKGQSAKKWFDQNSPVVKEKAKQSWVKLKSSTSAAKDKTMESLNSGRKWSSEKAKLLWLLTKNLADKKMIATRAWADKKYLKTKKSWQALDAGQKFAWTSVSMVAALILGVGIYSLQNRKSVVDLDSPPPPPPAEEVVEEVKENTLCSVLKGENSGTIKKVPPAVSLKLSSKVPAADPALVGPSPAIVITPPPPLAVAPVADPASVVVSAPPTMWTCCCGVDNIPGHGCSRCGMKKRKDVSYFDKPVSSSSSSSSSTSFEPPRMDLIPFDTAEHRALKSSFFGNEDSSVVISIPESVVSPDVVPKLHSDYSAEATDTGFGSWGWPFSKLASTLTQFLSRFNFGQKKTQPEEALNRRESGRLSDSLVIPGSIPRDEKGNFFTGADLSELSSRIISIKLPEGMMEGFRSASTLPNFDKTTFVISAEVMESIFRMNPVLLVSDGGCRPRGIPFGPAPRPAALMSSPASEPVSPVDNPLSDNSVSELVVARFNPKILNREVVYIDPALVLPLPSSPSDQGNQVAGQLPDSVQKDPQSTSRWFSWVPSISGVKNTFGRVKDAVLKKVMPDESGSVVMTASDFSLEDTINRRKESNGSNGSETPSSEPSPNLIPVVLNDAELPASSSSSNQENPAPAPELVHLPDSDSEGGDDLPARQSSVIGTSLLHVIEAPSLLPVVANEPEQSEESAAFRQLINESGFPTYCERNHPTGNKCWCEPSNEWIESFIEFKKQFKSSESSKNKLRSLLERLNIDNSNSFQGLLNRPDLLPSKQSPIRVNSQQSERPSGNGNKLIDTSTSKRSRAAKRRQNGNEPVVAESP